jgi:hypothetical protein
MDYSVGSRIRVRLYSGKIVEAEITAITKQSTGLFPSCDSEPPYCIDTFCRTPILNSATAIRLSR